MFARLFIILAIVSGTTVQAHEEFAVSRLDFKIAMLEGNYQGVVHLPNFSRARALSIVSDDGSEVFEDAEYCFEALSGEKPVWEVFRENYEKRRAELTTEFTNSEYSIAIAADVKSFFGLSGELQLTIKSSYSSPQGDFQVLVDDFDFNRAALKVSGSPYCATYRSIFEDSFLYLGGGRHMVANAFFISGSVQQTYEMSLSGSGKGEVSSDQIVDFLRRVGVPKKLAKIFDARASLEVNGSVVEGRTLEHYFGEVDSYASAFIPYGVNSSNSRSMLDSVDEVGGEDALDEFEFFKDADAFLRENPKLDFLSPEFENPFGGEGAVPFESLSLEERQRFGRVLSKILHLNRVGGRL